MIKSALSKLFGNSKCPDRLLMNGFTGVGSAKRDEVYRGEGMAPGSPQAAWLTVSHSF